VRPRRGLDPALRQLLRNAGWLLLSDGTVLVAGLLGTLVAARALGAQEFGRLTLVSSVIGVAHLLVDVRAWEAVTRYLSEFTSRRQPGLALATLKLAVLAEGAVAVLGFGLVWLASGLVATRLFNDPSLRPLILLGAATLVVTAFDRTARAVLRVFDRFGALGLCSAIEAVLSLVLVIAAVTAGARAKGVLVAHLVAAAAGAALLLAVAGREVRVRLWAARASARISAVSRYRKEMLAFVGHSAVRATLKVLTRRFDLILLGHFRSPAEVGTYGAALRLAQVMEEISDPLYFAAFPQLARAWVQARDEFFRLVRLMAIGLAVVTSAVVIVGAVAAQLIVSLALGPTYAAAADPFRLLLFSTGVAVATLWATPAMLGSGHPAAATAAATAGAAVLAVLLVVLVPAWGVEGAAWARVGGALGYLAVVLPWLVRAKRRTLRSTR
jgi:O-antigen/teichoic acid export membrane protein